MPSTYSDLKLELQATGENSTTWGDITNLNLEAIEEALAMSATVTFASANQTLILANTNSSQPARALRLRCAGTTGGSLRDLNVPAFNKLYIVRNDCADGVNVKTPSGTGVVVAPATSRLLYVDGTNVVDALSGFNIVTQTSGTLPVNRGGTGQTSLTSGVLLKGNGTGAVEASLFSESGSTMSLFGNLLFASPSPTLTFNTGGPSITSPAAGTLAFNTSGIERARVDNNGNVGIGNTSPGYRLDITSADTTPGVGYIMRLRANASANAATIQFTDNGVTAERATVTVDNNQMAFSAQGSRRLSLFTNGVERVRVTSAGLVGVNNASPAEALHVIGNIRASGNVISDSDETIKEDIRTIDKALDKVKHMRGVTYIRKDTGEAGTGVVAQELLTVMPEAVVVGEDLLGVAYGNLVGVLIEAIKELSAEVAELRAAGSGQ